MRKPDMEQLRELAEQLVGPLPLGWQNTDVLRQRHELEVVHTELEIQCEAMAELQARAAQSQHALVREQRLVSHMMHDRGRERQQLARDIQDELAQNLLALRMDVASFGARTAGTHGLLNARAEQMLGHVDVAIRNARGMIDALHPPVLQLGLPAAIEWLAARFQRDTGIDCRLRVPDDEAWSLVGGGADETLFLALREALANVRHHARASRVELALDVTDGWIELSVADNGIGMAPDQRGKPDTFGLHMVAEGVARLGGKLAIDDYVAGRGCRLTIRIPRAGEPPRRTPGGHRR